MTTAIVCGGDEYQDQKRIDKVLSAAVDRLKLDHVVVSGYAGARLCACDWALRHGVTWSISPDLAVDADMIMAFPGSIDMQAKGVTVYEVK